MERISECPARYWVLVLGIAIGAARAGPTPRRPDGHRTLCRPPLAVHRPVPRRRTVGATGVPGQPNVFYIGVNNGGVWKTTDYGRVWTPIFDDQPTGSIGALAVAPSNPDVIYVGSGEGLQRPDLSRRRRRLQIHRRRQDLEEHGPARRPADSGDHRRSEESRPRLRRRARPSVRAQRRARRLPLDRRRQDLAEGALQGREHRRHGPGLRPGQRADGLRRALGGAAGAVGERRLARAGQRAVQVDRRRHDLEAADQGPARRRSRDWAASASTLRRADPKRLYAMVDAPRLGGALPLRRRRRNLAADQRRRSASGAAAATSPRSRSIRRTRTSSTSPTPPATAPTDGGKIVHLHPRRARRRRLSHRLDQPRRPEHHPARQRPGGDRHASTAARRGARWYNQPTAQFYHVITDNQFPYWVYGGQQESGSAGVVQPRQRRADHLPRLAPGRRRGVRLRRPGPARSGHHLRRQGHALRPPHRPGAERRPGGDPHAASTASCARPRWSSRRSIRKSLYFAGNVLFKTTTAARAGTSSAPT